MDSLDLDIANYDLHDLLRLFKLDSDFGEKELKSAKQIVLKTHPDKSKLDKKYFIFFSKAYKTLVSIHVFKNNAVKLGENNESQEYVPLVTGDNEGAMADALDYFFESNERLKNPKQFNRWFNEQFEKTKIDSDDSKKGYGDWLRSDDDIEPEKNVTKASMNQEFEKKKREVSALVVKRDIAEFNGSGPGFSASMLVGDAPEEFCGDLFSRLPYQDLQQAHRVSVIPVTQEDFAAVPKFANVDAYKIHRDTETLNMKPLSETQALNYLNRKSKQGEEESTRRAFQLAQQMEEAQNKSKEFWGTIHKITYK